MPATTIKLDIMSDPICPWCYIGKTYLDRALEQNSDHPFQIEWHPFQLNPDMPPEGMDRRAYLETAAVSALFKAYFVEGRDIGDIDTLSDIADGIELDAAVIRRLLDSDADQQQIIDRDAHSRKMGITSVPTFIVAGKHAVPGAQPPELWSKVIAELNEQESNS